MKIAVKDLKPNPFRHLERYPIDRAKVDALKASIQCTEFWDNLLARKNGAGYEIAYGHHRLKALKELKVKEIDIPVRDLDDETMLKIMANENMEEWGASALIEQETIRATVQAFADGKVKLPQVAMKQNGMPFRIAPSFVTVATKCSREHLVKAYTAKTLSKFLGWPEVKVARTLTTLAIRESIGKDINFAGLSPKQAEVVVRETNYARKKNSDDELAVEIGKTHADNFRSASGGIHTVRRQTDSMLRDNRAERIAAKGRAESDKAELEEFDHQVKEFMDANTAWMKAVEAAKKAISKFSPEARQFAIRRLDQSVAAESELKATLAKKETA